MLAPAILFADIAGTVEVSNRTEFRVREQGETAPPIVASVPSGTMYRTGNAAAGTTSLPVVTSLVNPGIDLVDVPALRLELKEHTWDSLIDYSAFTILPDLELGLPVPQVLQSADAGITWHDARARLGITEYGQYGETNSIYLGAGGTTPPPPGGTTVQLLATPTTINFGSTRTDLIGRYLFSRLVTGNALLEYFASGGIDDASRTVLPIVNGPRAEAAVSYRLTRTDAFETKVTGLISGTSSALLSVTAEGTGTTEAVPCVVGLKEQLPAADACIPQADTAAAFETWRRQLTRHSDAYLGAGVSATFARLSPQEPYSHDVLPAAIAGFQYRSSVEQVRSVLRLDAQLAPLVDARTGIVDDRAQLTLTLELPFHDFTFTGSLYGTRSVNSLFTEPVTGVQGYFEVEYEVTRYMSTGGGVRAAWQTQEGVGTFTTGLLFAQVTFKIPKFHF
jgi:hypothetical protein